MACEYRPNALGGLYSYLSDYIPTPNALGHVVGHTIATFSVLVVAWQFRQEDKPMRVTIKADWLSMCGYHVDAAASAAWRTFDVIRTMPGRLPDGTRMFIVEFHGRPWTVAEWRIENIEE